MSIESVWIAALDRRKEMVSEVEKQVEKYLHLPLNKFWSGSGNDPAIKYDRIDSPATEELFRHCTYGVGEGRKNHANAFLSHREIFRKILSEGYNNALCLEEDIYFVENRWNTIYFSNTVQEFINSESMWDAIYFSWHQEEYPGDSSELNSVEFAWKEERKFSIERAKPIYISICGLHAILLNRRLLERLSKINVGPMDQYLNQNLQRFKLFYIAPQIIGSLASYSAAEGRFQPRNLLV